MTLELRQFDPPTASGWGALCVSPFCTKTETWLKLAGLDYETGPWNPGLSSAGKAPVVLLDGETIPDSGRIIERLSRHFDVDLDAGLSAELHAQGSLVRRTLEEHTYWVELHRRYVTEAGWRTYAPILGSVLPVPTMLRPLLLWWLRRGVRKSLWAHGLGRQTPLEIEARGRADWKAVLSVLGDRDFLLGSEPTSFDATVYAFAVHTRHAAWTDALNIELREDPRLTAYLERMDARLG